MPEAFLRSNGEKGHMKFVWDEPRVTKDHVLIEWRSPFPKSDPWCNFELPSYFAEASISYGTHVEYRFHREWATKFWELLVERGWVRSA